MKKIWSSVSSIEFNKTEWLAIKICLMVFWLKTMLSILLTYKSIPIPNGIFSLFTVSEKTLVWVNPIVLATAVILLVAYLAEFKMPITTLLIFGLSVFSFSLEEANGVLRRSGLFSYIFFAQAIAYIIPLFNKTFTPKNNRILFPIQAIAATYTLSALSKLQATGINWVFSGKQMALQVLKSYQYKYVTTGNWMAIERGNEMAGFMQNHPRLITAMLAITLTLELFALLSLRNRYSIFAYGVMLTLMHFSMAIVMDINLSSISTPMFIFMVVPGIITWFSKRLSR